MILAHRLALDTTYKQRKYFSRACGVARFSYNWALAEWTKQYAAGNKPTALKLKQQWNAIRREQYPWSYEVTKCASNQAIIDLGAAFKNFFSSLKSKQQAKYPKFKRRGTSRDSFKIWNDQFRVVGNTVLLPHIGCVRLRESLRFDGKILSATISRTADKWFISFAVDVADVPTQNQPQESVGLDLGINHLAVLSHPMSEGTIVFNNPKPLKAATVRLKKLQRGCSRQEAARKQTAGKKSKRAVKRTLKLSRAHATVANIRKDALHKMTTKITSEFKVVVIEDLNVAGMLKNHNLAGSIADAAFSEIRRQLTYKAKLKGGFVRVIGRFVRSTGVCPDCGTAVPKLSLSVRQWECPCCSRVWDRDIAAARIIHKVGTACPEPAVDLQLTRRETSALVAAKATTKLKSLNCEPHCTSVQRRKQVCYEQARLGSG